MKKEIASCIPVAVFLFAWHNPQISLLYILGGAMVLGSGYLLSTELSRSHRAIIIRTMKNADVFVRTEDNKIKYPVIAHTHKEDYGSKFIFKLPDGMSEQKFLDNQRAFEVALNAEVSIYERNGLVVMEIYSHELPNNLKGGIKIDTADRVEPSRGGLD